MNIPFFRNALAATVLVLVSACSGITPSPNAKRVADLPPPPKVAPDYLLQPGDNMDVKFAQNPELNESVVVRPDGRISLPLAPEVQAGGRSVAAVREEVSNLYARELKDPQMSLILRSFVGSRVYVGGEVNQPGELVAVGPISLLQAVYRAGGYKNLADVEQVVLIRRGEAGPQYYVVDLKKALEGADLSQDVQLASYDVVFVPKSGVGNVASFFQDVVRPILPLGFTVAYGI